jgi:flagellar secretion chaperone FliS
MSLQNPRDTYLAATVSTASPAQLLVMLCERLNLDVERAAAALRDGRPTDAHAPLLHAQEIVLELNASLQADAWAGGPALASIYDFLHSQLVKANVGKDLMITESCLTLVAELRDTWRAAATEVLAASA